MDKADREVLSRIMLVAATVVVSVIVGAVVLGAGVRLFLWAAWG